jgi:hypothetical protein
MPDLSPYGKRTQNTELHSFSLNKVVIASPSIKEGRRDPVYNFLLDCYALLVPRLRGEGSQ